ncbi:VOC family protein [Halosolutus gelatinilyticus]|uniref:VOC family protein n=1 Tax=Halosolutus gelatinilyticus TaxID=2931975 RepID=UPI001FF22585|nr:VOC family protein [Halosolutus gelatinilyticus]
MFEKLSMVTRIVSDQEEALAFYRDKLGFEVTGDHEGPHGRFLTVAPEGDSTGLVLMSPDGFDDETAGQLETLLGNDFGLIYEVDDCRSAYETLREKGVAFRGEPEEMPWGTQAVALDTDGNEIVVQEPVASSSF